MWRRIDQTYFLPRMILNQDEIFGPVRPCPHCSGGPHVDFCKILSSFIDGVVSHLFAVFCVNLSKSFPFLRVLSFIAYPWFSFGFSYCLSLPQLFSNVRWSFLVNNLSSICSTRTVLPSFVLLVPSDVRWRRQFLGIETNRSIQVSEVDVSSIFLLVLA